MHIYVLEYICSFQILSVFFCFGIVVAYCDGMFVLFWDVCTVFWLLFLHVVFLFAAYVYHRKKHVPHAEKNTKHAHELQDCPPRHLLTFDSGLSFFPSFFCMF